MKKPLVLFIMLTLVSAHCLIKAEKSTVTSIYVDDDNSNGPWDGTIDHPYKLIQDAIDAAHQKDTITVSKGYYRENIVLNKELIVIGSDPTATIIDGGQKNSSVIISVDNCTFQGFQLINCSFEYLSFEHCLILISSDNNTIKNNLFSLRATHDFLSIAALQINQGDNNQINGNIFISDKNISRNHAIFLNGTCQNTHIINNLIHGFDSGLTDTDRTVKILVEKNQVTDNVFGLELFGSNYLIYENNISFNTATGLIEYEGTNNTISNNTFIENGHNNGVGGAPGIMIYRAAESLFIFHNDFIHNAGPGVYVYMSYHNKIAQNNFINNGWNYNQEKKPNAFFYTHIKNIFKVNDWDGNYWSPSSNLLIELIPSELRILTYFDFVYSLSWFAFDKTPAKDPYAINLYI